MLAQSGELNGSVKHVFSWLLILSCVLAEVADAADFSGVWQGSYYSYSGDSGSTYANIIQTGVASVVI